MLDTAIIDQLRDIFSPLEAFFTFSIEVADEDLSGTELIEFLKGVADSSEKIDCQIVKGKQLRFRLLKNGTDTGISFRGIPTGHEFTSLILAILNIDGKGKNLPDEGTTRRIRSLKGEIALTTYISLTCTNCPDIVQALNVLAAISERISHEMVDGGIAEREVEDLKLQGVPAVFADGKLLHVGRGTLGELLEKLEEMYGSELSPEFDIPAKRYDVLVLGGGPAGSSSAIYSARKGLKVAIIAERIGGQVKETVGIENLIATPKTTGEELSNNLRLHLDDYPIDIYENRKITNVTLNGRDRCVSVAGGERFSSSALIVATGAGWRRLNVPGEESYIGRGVAFCPHCDGPFYKGRSVAVAGGGNSGIEAAIDLAGICSKVTVLEFMDELKADIVLQEKLKSLPNVEVLLSSQIVEILGDGKSVTGIRIKNRKNDMERVISMDGIFVQIGLSSNSLIVKDIVETNNIGEVIIDANCRTSTTGIYAAGDVSTVPYKQIIIAMGEGAKASLSAFDDKIRGVI